MKYRETPSLYIHIDGIYCEHCVETITRALKRLDGVEQVSLRQNVAQVSGENLPSAESLIDTIRLIGYETDADHISANRRKVAGIMRWYEFLLIAAVILAVVFAVEKLFGYNIFNAIPAVDSSLSYGMLFVTGLLTSIHCVSMCGAIGIFASAESNSVRSIRRPLLYNAGRVISYTVIGGLVGMAGSVFSISMTIRGMIILAAAVFMLLMACSMLGLFRFSLPRVPALFPKRSASGVTAAFTVGLLNGLMPCGPLQAMQMYALSTGNILSGALSMMLFALGTVPLMLASGAVLNLIRGRGKILIGKVAAVLMVILALSMLNRGLLSFGIGAKNTSTGYEGYTAASVEDGVQTVEFDLDYDSYADIVVQKGIPVEVTVHADQNKITGCNNEIVSPDFGFDVPLSPGDNVFRFTPEKEGEFLYTCWMNMLSNRIKVVDDPEYFGLE